MGIGHTRMPDRVLTWWRRELGWCRSYWVGIAWAGVVGVNLAAMRRLPCVRTMPFLACGGGRTAS